MRVSLHWKISYIQFIRKKKDVFLFMCNAVFQCFSFVLLCRKSPKTQVFSYTTFTYIALNTIYV